MPASPANVSSARSAKAGVTTKQDPNPNSVACSNMLHAANEQLMTVDGLSAGPETRITTGAPYSGW
ncbi:MAG: hypothetical protein BWY79_01018 [Actinobacteria bacterium ADurb.Bin444]|nr:MAG: hypothetical protein BWY79_01018 [Actinobacteria bacterium ADurb.Bin444]